MGASNYQQSTYDGTIINSLTGLPSTWEPTSPAGSIGPAGGDAVGGGFNWNAAIAGMLQGVGAGLSSVGGSYGHVGAGILGGSQQVSQPVDDQRKLDYLQEAAAIDQAAWKQRVEDKMAAERADYEWQLERLQRTMAGFVAIDEGVRDSGARRQAVRQQAAAPTAAEATAEITTAPRSATPPPRSATPPPEMRAI